MVAEPTVPKKENCEFSAWIDESGVAYDFTKPVTKGFTLTATWKGYCIVKFNAANGSTETIVNVLEGTCVAEPVVPQKENCEFALWVDESGTKYDFTKPVTKSFTLKAAWNYNVKFNANNGSTETIVKVYEGTCVAEPGVPQKESCEFALWVDESGTKYDFTKPVTKSVELKALWNCSVKFNANNGSEETIVKVYEGTCVAEPGVPQKESCEFALWVDESGTKYDFTKPVTKSVELKALWNCSVKFNANNGSEETIVKVYEGTCVAEPGVPQKENCEFALWVDESGTKYDFTKPVTKSFTLKAAWNYNVKFNANNGSTETIVKVYEGTCVAEPSVPQKESCDFLYWTDENGTKFDFTKTIEKPTVITAYWKEYFQLKKGTEINNAIKALDCNTEAEYFKKSNTAPNSSVETKNIALEEGKSVPLWYDSESKTIYYYIGADDVLILNADSSNLFMDCQKLNEIYLEDFDTSKVTSMDAMFKSCCFIKKLDLRSFNTKNVESMKQMFSGCSSLEAFNVSSSFDTSNVKDMQRMFYNAFEFKFTTFDFSILKTDKVENMEEMFANCRLCEIDLSSFNTKNVKNMNKMFCCCYNTTKINISGFNTENVETMESMFYVCDKITELDLSSFDTKKVTSAKSMFQQCEKLKTLDISGFEFSNGVDITAIFDHINELEKIYVKEGTDWSNCSGEGSVFFCHYKLTGGKGTVRSGSDLGNDKTYARVDGGTEAPGFFTVKQ